MNFQKMHILGKYTDEAFDTFYERIFTTEHFSIFFDNVIGIRFFLKKQQKNFLKSFDDDQKGFEQRYKKLGEFHFNSNIPYANFLLGTKILSEIFIEIVVKYNLDSSLIALITNYFYDATEVMAKVYLKMMIRNDKKDLKALLKSYEYSVHKEEKVILIAHFEWLIKLIDAIDHEDETLAPNREADDDINKNTTQILDRIDPSTFNHFNKKYIENIYAKMRIDAKNIFFFIKEKRYAEALPIYTSLLEIYKLTLLLGNILSSSISMKTEKMYLEQSKLATYDVLTGAFNRRKYEEIIDYQLSHAQRYGRNLSLAMIDIDYFKKINDRYGHLRGDEILKILSQIVLSSIRSTDYFVRYGGEEFLILCPETNIEGVVRMVEKLRDKIATFDFGIGEKVSVSIGVTLALKEDTSKDLLDRVDKLLYKAKNEGRDRVCH